MGFVVVIPARYASQRLPGKPLLSIAGRPMIEHVYRRAVSSGADEVIVATDDDRVREVAEGFGAAVCMTAREHPSGTDRVAEVVRARGYSGDTIVVNLQGDEPLMPPALVHQVAQDLARHPQAAVATLCEPIATAAELFDPHVVKVVMDHEGYAIYFSRAAIPWDRDAFSVTTEELPERSQHYRHIGLYAYRAGFVQEFVSWPVCALERMESLEQLRVLWRGRRISVALAQEHPGHGVDTEQDRQRVAALLADRG